MLALHHTRIGRTSYLDFATWTTDFSCEGCTAGNDFRTRVRTLSSVEDGDNWERNREVYRTQ